MAQDWLHWCTAQGQKASPTVDVRDEGWRDAISSIMPLPFPMTRYLLTCNAFTNKVFQQCKVVVAHTVLLDEGEGAQWEATPQQTIQLIAATGYEDASM